MAITRQKDGAGSEPNRSGETPREKPAIKVSAEKAKGGDGSGGAGTSGGGKGGGGKGGKPEGGLAQNVNNVLQFLREALIEFRKVTWPTSREIIRTTYSVLFLIAAITIAVLAFDYLVAQFFFTPIEHWARLHGGGVGTGH